MQHEFTVTMTPKLPAMFLAFSLLVVMSVSVVGDELADSQGEAVRAAVAKVEPSVVRIRTVGSGSDTAGISSQVTTGLVISDDGYLVSSTFGFPSAMAAVFVEDSDGQRVAARVLARDSLRQLVLLKCDEGRFVPPVFSKGRWPDVGAYAIAVGRFYPSKTPTLSLGIISASKRVFGMAIQTDAKISPVNYGGPLISLDGSVFGLLVPMSPRQQGESLSAGVEWYDSGIGFAVPAVDLLAVARRMMENGDLKRGAMGIELSTQNPLFPIVQIRSVLAGSPADQAGLKVADIITRVNGVVVDRVGVFHEQLKSSYAGDRLSLQIQRQDDSQTVDLTLAAKLERPEKSYLGVVLIEEQTADQQPKVRIRAAAVPGSPAAAEFQEPFFTITEINGKPVQSLSRTTGVFGRIGVGEQVELSVIRDGDEAAASRKVALTAVSRPENPVAIPDAVASAFVDSASPSLWKQQEQDVGEGGRVWLFGPEDSETKVSGLVFLLSESTTDVDRILERWGDVCESRGLALVVPRNAEKRSLSTEDMGLILGAARAATERFRVPIIHRVLVTSEDQALLTRDLLLMERGRIAVSAVFVKSRPPFSAVPSEQLSARQPRILILSGLSQSRQQAALLEQTRREMREARIWHAVDAANDDPQQVSLQIADWLILQSAG